MIADAFGVLNALKDVHQILAEGAHNQFGDLVWTARSEMLIQQWILSRPEFREFLGGRTMVAYREPWMDRVDSMRQMLGWGDTSVTHFRDLGVFGERLLLSIRYGNWSMVNDSRAAENWARYWRPEVKSYMHSYRSVTGVEAERAGAGDDRRLARRSLHPAGGAAPAPPGAGPPGAGPAAGGPSATMTGRRSRPARTPASG